MPEMISLEEARALVLSHAAPLPVETVPVLEAVGRVAAADLKSDIDISPFAHSAMDGFAVRAAELAEASQEAPVELDVVAEIAAGDVFEGSIEAGQCVRIMTGAPIPAGADCVIRQEDTDRGHPCVQIYQELRHHENYCFAGEDYQKGGVLLAAGTVLDAAALGVLAGAGLWERPMAIYPRPRVLLAGTGDELVRPGQPLKPGQIYNSNLPQLAARCRQLGLAADTVWWPDDPRAVADGLTAGVRDFDCVITTGGVSVGDKDIFHQALPLAGAERLFWRVKLKPGTPLMFSLLEGRPVLSLSGNPFAAAATFELLARPLLAALAGQRDWQPLTLTAPLATPFSKASGGRRFVRGIYRDGAVTLPEGHSSGQLRSQVGCNCLVDIPAGSPPLAAGTMVKVVLL